MRGCICAIVFQDLLFHAYVFFAEILIYHDEIYLAGAISALLMECVG